MLLNPFLLVVVARTRLGHVLHMRTMDWEMAFDLRAHTIDVEFYDERGPVCVATTWPGYVGILTGMRLPSQHRTVSDAYAISLNTRVCKDGFVANFVSYLLGGWPAGNLMRRVLMSCQTYDDAVRDLRSTRLIAPCFITVSTASRAVQLSRSRTGDTQALVLSPRFPIIVQANLPHWVRWPDLELSLARRAKGRQLLLQHSPLPEPGEELWSRCWNILSVTPIYNASTLHATVMCPRTQFFQSRPAALIADNINPKLGNFLRNLL